MDKIIMISLIVLVIYLIIVSHVIYYRSFLASLYEFLIKILNVKKIGTIEMKYDEIIKEKIGIKDKKFKLPKYKFASNITELHNGKNSIYKLTAKTDSSIIMLYIHGGSYISEPLIFHWTFCDKLTKELGIQIIFPIYSLAPNHTWKEAYVLLEEIYLNILNENKKIIIMGDSAGGGLAMGFCEYLAKKNYRQPDKIILLSPWLDISMSNSKIKEFDNKDPMLSVYGLRKSGQMWAGDLDIKDYKVSPIYGSLKKINNVYLFVGTREVFYPDVTDFYEKLQKKHINSQIFIGQSLNHVYPLFPMPEGKDAYQKIVEIIRELQ